MTQRNKKNNGMTYNSDLTYLLTGRREEKKPEPLNTQKPQKPNARQKRIVGEGKAVYKWGKGLIEEAVGGKTTAQSVYHQQNPALKNLYEQQQQKKTSTQTRQRKTVTVKKNTQNLKK